MRLSRRSAPRAWALAVATTVVCALSWGLAIAADPFPASRPVTRLQAFGTLAGGVAGGVPCLTPIAQTIQGDPQGVTPAARRALTLLQSELALPGERRIVAPDGTLVRYTIDRSSLDRIDGGDEDGNGRPDEIDAALSGIADARRILQVRLEIPLTSSLEVVFGRIGYGHDGVVMPTVSRDGRPVIFLESAPRGGHAATRRAAVHQAMHIGALALGPEFPASWSEALATWATLRSDGGDARSLAFVDHRIQRLADGFAENDLALTAGNAAWLAFLEDAYGPTSLRLTLDELGRGTAIGTAIDLALQRSVGARFGEAFRDFHLWALFVGDRSDGRHFPFASRLADPPFAASVTGLPSLSIQADPPVAGLGAVQIRLRPNDVRGGMTVRFEGEFSGRWSVDLLLVRRGNDLHRIPIVVSSDGHGEVTVPLDRLSEAVLLVRSLDPDPSTTRRYTWSAFRVPGYPFEATGLSAVAQDGPVPGVLVSWETASESGVLGFNLWRVPTEGGTPVLINPVWVPAVGDRSIPALYQYLDTSADPSVPASYAVEGITGEGLTSRSEPVAVVTTAP